MQDPKNHAIKLFSETVLSFGAGEMGCGSSAFWANIRSCIWISQPPQKRHDCPNMMQIPWALWQPVQLNCTAPRPVRDHLFISLSPLQTCAKKKNKKKMKKRRKKRRRSRSRSRNSREKIYASSLDASSESGGFEHKGVRIERKQYLLSLIWFNCAEIHGGGAVRCVYFIELLDTTSGTLVSFMPSSSPSKSLAPNQ